MIYLDWNLSSVYWKSRLMLLLFIWSDIIQLSCGYCIWNKPWRTLAYQEVRPRIGPLAKLIVKMQTRKLLAVRWFETAQLSKWADPNSSRSYQTFFSSFFLFGVKLGHFTINNFFLYVTKMQAYQQKTEKFFVIEEKKFGRIISGADPIKLFFFADKEFLCFSLQSEVILLSVIFFYM